MKTFNFDEALIALQSDLGFAYKLTADKHDAEDLLQETMLKALDNKDKFDPGTNFKGWMYIIMRNAFINNYRIKKSQGDLYILSEPNIPEYKCRCYDNNHICQEKQCSRLEVRELQPQ